MKVTVPDDKKATEYLANERTFLAWIRTSIAIISLGFVVAKSGVWLRAFAARLDPTVQTHGHGTSLWMGVEMMSFGAILPLLAVWRYRIVNLAIERGEVKADRGLILLVTAAVALLAMAMIIYLLLTVDHL